MIMIFGIMSGKSKSSCGSSLCDKAVLELKGQEAIAQWSLFILFSRKKKTRDTRDFNYLKL